jgi:hypothetical protein
LKAIKAVPLGHKGQEIHLVLSKKVTAVEIMNLLKFQPNWKISGETLKRDIQGLGFHWIESMKEALQKLRPQKKKLTNTSRNLS